MVLVTLTILSHFLCFFRINSVLNVLAIARNPHVTFTVLITYGKVVTLFYNLSSNTLTDKNASTGTSFHGLFQHKFRTNTPLKCPTNISKYVKSSIIIIQQDLILSTTNYKNKNFTYCCYPPNC